VTKARHEGNIFQADLLNNAYRLTENNQIRQDNTRGGRGVFLGGQRRPHCKGAGPKRMAELKL